MNWIDIQSVAATQKNKNQQIKYEIHLYTIYISNRETNRDF